MAVALVFYVLVTAVVSVVVTAALYLVAALSRVVSMGQFARAMLTPQIIGFTSRSSVAALPAMIEASEQQLKLPDEVTRAFLPFLVSIFRVAGSIVICVGAVFVAWLYGIPLHGNQLLTVGLLSMVLSFAVPGIPSGGIFVSAPVLAAVGLPVEAIGILLAVDPLSDMFRTVANVTAHLSLSTLAARILLGKRTSA
jgi:Na+/H+-dicarboxylate symporter